jgi:hypothetical protein
VQCWAKKVTCDQLQEAHSSGGNWWERLSSKGQNGEYSRLCYREQQLFRLIGWPLLGGSVTSLVEVRVGQVLLGEQGMWCRISGQLGDQLLSGKRI